MQDVPERGQGRPARCGGLVPVGGGWASVNGGCADVKVRLTSVLTFGSTERSKTVHF
ncbi:hypothetical protein KPATCC21470_3053 [Kitasatospora purpeofusca]